MKLLHLNILLLIISAYTTSCYPKCCDPMLDPGNWAKRTNFPGSGRSEAEVFTIGNFSYLGTGWSGDNIRLEISGNTIL